MNYQCKVCAYSQMPSPPEDYSICPCCGVEYGVDDAFESYRVLRDDWLREGGHWFSQRQPYQRPVNWNAWDQLDLAEYDYGIPRPPRFKPNVPLSRQVREEIERVRPLLRAAGFEGEAEALLAAEAYWRESVKTVSPMIWKSETGRPYCVFCGEFADEHEPDCPWVEAQR